MRHKIAGKRLSRRAEERTALARNLTAALFEQFGETDREFIFTTITKAKWVKPFAERCITIGIKGYRELQKAADANGSTIEELRQQHEGDKEKPFKERERKKFKDFPPAVQQHLAKAMHYRREALSRLRDVDAVRRLFDDIAPRYLDRPGGYLRVLRTSKIQLGNSAQRAILGFVGAEQEAAV